MRLWHQRLMSILPDSQLRGMHSEICGMRGNGWGKKNKTVNYVWDYSPARLVVFHWLVMDEIDNRKLCKLDMNWYDEDYRGKILGNDFEFVRSISIVLGELIYQEHNDNYLQECIDNLKTKLETKKQELSSGECKSIKNHKKQIADLEKFFIDIKKLGSWE